MAYVRKFPDRPWKRHKPRQFPCNRKGTPMVMRGTCTLAEVPDLKPLGEALDNFERQAHLVENPVPDPTPETEED